ncbi:PE-PPE domain-containing protein [Mycobacterium sp. SMC-2]|uniref:PE family protein n=1 Tax=Mycobacterium sp. SMC-2 TaxID=2857058 RepID=UPI00220651EE|nr:PE-PPE domain-containing protein [Mycobacterium sp. SMC-2]UXA08952.1 PE-PPE domain-containing protein [Mycobacterium sp. SMC-2]
MSFVVTAPDTLAAAAADLQGIGSTIAAADGAAATPTTVVFPPAADAVSVRTATLFAAYGQRYQELSARAAAFHDQFVQTLIASRDSYAEAEASNAAATQLTSGLPAQTANATGSQLLSPALASPMQSTPTTTTSSNVALIMGGTGNPQPNAAYLSSVYNTYIAPHYPGYSPVGLTTPEDFWPVTGLTSQTFGQSVRQGVAILNNAIMSETGAGNHVVVLGYSQSATIATLEMRYLDALPAAIRPSSDLLSFVLLSDPNVPGTGILTHFIPGFGAFHVLTPVDTLYQTAIYTVQYDPIAYFPRSIFNIAADLNALLGFPYLHSTYPNLTVAQLATAIQTHIGVTTYYLIPTQNLPLLEPLRMIPILGDPLADLLQPFIRPFVDFGYATGLPGPFQSISITAAGSLPPVAAQAIPEPIVAALSPPPDFPASFDRL